MALPVITVASGGMPVSNMAAGGMPVTEVALALGGIPVTKVTGALPGLGVTYVSATGGPAVTYTAFDNATVSNVTLSGGNLIATHPNINSNAGVRSSSLKTTGKFYFEVTVGQATVDNVIGIITNTGTYANFVSGTTDGTMVRFSGGIIWATGTNTGKALGNIVATNVVAVAVDIGARKMWLCKNSGNWNGEAIGLQDPANGIGGVAVFAGAPSFAPCVGFAGLGTSGDVMTANFGASAFVGAVPSGFTAGWPA